MYNISPYLSEVGICLCRSAQNKGGIYIIAVGDNNCVINKKLDKLRLTGRKVEGRVTLLSHFIEEFHKGDIWVLNPEGAAFSC